MPLNFEIHLKGVLVTCVGFLASSLGVFVSILSVIVSPLFSLFSTPKPIFIGEGKAGLTPRLQHPSQKIRPRHVRQPSSDQHSSHSSNSNTLSSDSIPSSIYSNRTIANGPSRTPSPNGTKTRNDTHNTPESPVPPRLASGFPSPRDGLRTYLDIRKLSTLHDGTALVELSSASGDLDSDEQGLDRAQIIISPPTPSSAVFLHSAPGPSNERFGDVSTASKPAARFVKSHSKRHSLSISCPRKRRPGKRSSNPPTPKSASPATTPMVESKWQITTRASQRKKRNSLRINPPPRSAASPVLIDGGDDVGGGIIYEEPVNVPRPPAPRLPLTPARQGPVRTRPYEAPYFFPTPGSPEAFGYVERVREERRSVLVHPDAMFVRQRKDLKRPSTIFNFEKDGAVGTPKRQGSNDQVTEDGGRKRTKSSGKGSAPDRNFSPPFSAPIDVEFGGQVGAPTKLRKGSAPPQFSPFHETVPTQTTSSRPQVQRQGSLGIMRILGKH